MNALLAAILALSLTGAAPQVVSLDRPPLVDPLRVRIYPAFQSVRTLRNSDGTAYSQRVTEYRVDVFSAFGELPLIKLELAPGMRRIDEWREEKPWYEDGDDCGLDGRRRVGTIYTFVAVDVEGVP